MGSADGARKTAAKRLGLTLAEYEAKVAAALKWCGRCREWHPTAAFGADLTRGDRLASRCADSQVVNTAGTGTRERRLRAAQGTAWCRGCEEWLPQDAVRNGVCRTHAAEEGRAHYAKNTDTVRARKISANRIRQQLGTIPAWWRDERTADFGGLCAYGCGRPASGFDHVLAITLGGETRPANLVPACHPCNSGKKNQQPGPWLDRFAAAFPDQFEAFVALTFEHGASLEVV
jgi:5-methylcytosine-specific restriction endonuclease McrA